MIVFAQITYFPLARSGHCRKWVPWMSNRKNECSNSIFPITIPQCSVPACLYSYIGRMHDFHSHCPMVWNGLCQNGFYEGWTVKWILAIAFVIAKWSWGRKPEVSIYYINIEGRSPRDIYIYINHSGASHPQWFINKYIVRASALTYIVEGHTSQTTCFKKFLWFG